jgi:hypothetical protein
VGMESITPGIGMRSTNINPASRGVCEVGGAPVGARREARGALTPV